MEIDEPCAWAMVVLYIKRLSKCMRLVESGIAVDNLAWCGRHIFAINTDDREGAHWFLCLFDGRVQLELFIILVREPLRCIHLINP